MSESTSNTENDDLDDDVPLVRMRDMQPARQTYDKEFDSNEVMETTVVADNLNYICENNDDSNAGSQSAHSADVVGTEYSDSDSDSRENVPDEIPIDIPPQDNKTDVKPNLPESWPTLEILPGGVIKHADKDEDSTANLTTIEVGNVEDSGDLMYACAKCPERFKYLYCLVKHVRWHGEQKKKEEGDVNNLNSLERDLLAIKKVRLQTEREYREKKINIMTRIVTAISKFDEDTFF